MSVDYYIRLEQARGPHPSRQVLASMARALMLSGDEREYLFRVADQHPPAAARPSRELTPAVTYLLASLPHTPAYVVDAKYDILAWNLLATHFIGDLSTIPAQGRNMLRRMFGPDDASHWDDDDALAFPRSLVADLRASYAAYSGDPAIAALIGELRRSSARFTQMWEGRDVEVRRRVVKKMKHPLAGQLEFECQLLHIPDCGQRLIAYCAEPGSPTQRAFARLAAAGSRGPGLAASPA